MSQHVYFDIDKHHQRSKLMASALSVIVWLQGGKTLEQCARLDSSMPEISYTISAMPKPFGEDDLKNTNISDKKYDLIGYTPFLNALKTIYKDYIKHNVDTGDYEIMDDYAELSIAALNKLTSIFRKEYDTIKHHKSTDLLDNTERLSLIETFELFRYELLSDERYKSRNPRRSNQDNHFKIWGSSQ